MAADISAHKKLSLPTRIHYPLTKIDILATKNSISGVLAMQLETLPGSDAI